jgi:spermidine/putrescine transport system permease protein
MASRVQPTRRQRANPDGGHGFWLAFPAMFWMVAFFIVPVLIVFMMSFMTRSRTGAELPLTFKAYNDIFGEFYEVDEIQAGIEDFQAATTGAEQRAAVSEIIEPDNGRARVFVRSIWVSVLATVICLGLGYPLGYYISTRQSGLMRSFTLFLVVLPFWTNFLVRTYAWRVILGQEGVLNNAMLALGLIQQPITMLFTPWAVLVGLVYGFLPFMVLPIYASVERFDFKLVEAANDLGANDWSAFWRVVLPGTMPGVVAGCILVFIPSIGSYVTPDLLGGGTGNSLMIGNLIADWFGATGNWPRGSAISVAMMVLVLGSLLVYWRFGQPQTEART